MSDLAPLRERRYVSFPPQSGFLLLPATSARAAYASLALYDTSSRRQRVVLTVGAALTRTGLHRWLPTNERADVDWDWWESLATDIAVPLVGPVGHIAMRVPPAQFKPCALLLDTEGRPTVFAKADAPPFSGAEAAVRGLLSAAEPSSFRITTVLASGEHDGVQYRLLQPLPRGPHWSPPLDPPHLWRIIDEFREVLASLPRPSDTLPDHVPSHGDMHVRNVRVASDGRWWLIDWERFKWAPRLADELRFWSSAFDARRGRRARNTARQVLELLRARGSDDDVLEALRWPGYQPQRSTHQDVYRDVERALLADR